MTDIKHLPYYNVIYILLSIVIIKPILGVMAIYMRVTNEAELFETSLSGTKKLDMFAVFTFVNLFIALKGQFFKKTFVFTIAGVSVV